MVDLKIQLPKGFLEEEERCGYVVSKQIKEVWAVELDLLSEFQRVCDKYDIKYVACGGTMLGAVRHNGFIPWDDDIDIMMLRSEYDKLCSIAPREFGHPYFFQTEYTDFGTLRGHAQLRNSLTSAILKHEGQRKYGFNQGIFIDIFPLDFVVEDEKMRKRQKEKADRYRSISFFLSGFVPGLFASNKKGIIRNVKKAVGIMMERPLVLLTDCYYKRFEKECARYNGQAGNVVSQLSMGFIPLYFRDLEDIVNTCLHKFEFMEIPISRNYEHALTKRFGNWKEYVVGNSLHGELFFDTSKSYIEHLK